MLHPNLVMPVGFALLADVIGGIEFRDGISEIENDQQNIAI